MVPIAAVALAAGAQPPAAPDDPAGKPAPNEGRMRGAGDGAILFRMMTQGRIKDLAELRPFIDEARKAADTNDAKKASSQIAEALRLIDAKQHARRP
jgi:hypothetical protein